MAYGKVDPSGCCERNGSMQVKLGLYLSPDDPRYWDAKKFEHTDWNCKEALAGFQGKAIIDPITGESVPVDWEEYAAWVASLPRTWLKERQFHSHFIYLNPYTMRDGDIEAAIAWHMPNFFKAYNDGWDASPGGMRHGWDVACRIRPERINQTRPEQYAEWKAETLSKASILRTLNIAIAPPVIDGREFPSTDIDVGSAAINRGSIRVLGTGTHFFPSIEGGNPANDDGSLDTVETYVNMTSTGSVEAFTCYEDVSAPSFTCRDLESLGKLSSTGLVSFTGLDIDVLSGDLLGIQATAVDSVKIDMDTSGGTRVWYHIDEAFIVDSTISFNYSFSSWVMSLYGTGETAGWTNIAKVSGITATDLAKIDGVAVADIAKVNGVAV